MLQNSRYHFTFLPILGLLFLPFFLAFCLSSCSGSQCSPYLQTAEDLLWKNPDSCIVFLDSLEQSELSEFDRNVCLLFREHATMKVMRGLEDDSIVVSLKNYFEEQNDKRYAGEANYIIGRNYGLEQNSPLATFYLKVAEEQLTKVRSIPNPLLGAVYYGLGVCAEDDRLFEVAYDYYLKALPFCLLSGDSMYISCTYRDIAKTGPADSELALGRIDSAILYAPSFPPTTRLEAEIAKYVHILHDTTPEMMRDYHYLCDSLGCWLYAIDLCEYYLSLHQLDTAYHYLTLSALDTANSYWSKEHYLFNKACYLAEVGLKDSAIEVLKDLHLEQTADIESSSFARAYMVEQRYDAERERMEKMQAHTDKRQAFLCLLLVIVGALLIISVLVFLWWREVMQKRQKEERNQYLKDQLRLKQEQLQQKLRQRLDLTNQLTHLKANGNTFTKETYNQLLSTIVFTHPAQWQVLLEDFDSAYAGVLTELTRRFDLSNIERIYIALVGMGCTTMDISLLLNVSPQSASNRKQMIRQHLQIEGRIEDWLHGEMQNGISRLLQ